MAADHEPTSWLARVVPVCMNNPIRTWLVRGSSFSTVHLGMVLMSVWVGLTGLTYAVDKKKAIPLPESQSELKLIELFTSHGCSSCPAADRLLGELLAEDTDLLALEYHVDYWNSLVHGSDGNFIDPFSRPAFSKRQRDYNNAPLAGRPGVYTPQAIINGATAVVGSNRRRIEQALATTSTAPLQVAVAEDDPDSSSSILTIRVSGEPEQRVALNGVDITLVRYIDSAVTRITGGENRHKELVNHRIVTGSSRLGEVSASGQMIFTAARAQAGEGCVVLVQEGASTPVYAAARCP